MLFECVQCKFQFEDTDDSKDADSKAALLRRYMDEILPVMSTSLQIQVTSAELMLVAAER